ncbi:hypothetical protein M0R45_021044 [Rubus argutus]|uniref:HMA domain-containing protein n=1 Tax=Rubus argutus TaxID=59490 RepID=A0AAW1XAA8_RUBAR
MVPELEKPRITEIHVRMDCNGCVQKIKKALHGINGIYDLYIDFPQQKLTIIGWADPEKILLHQQNNPPKARLHQLLMQQTLLQQNHPHQPKQLHRLKQPHQPSHQRTRHHRNHPTPEAEPTRVAAETNPGQQHPVYYHRPRDVGEVHTIYHHPPGYGYRYGYTNGYPGYWNKYHNSQGHPPEPTPAPAPPPPPTPAPAPVPVPVPAPPIYVTHSYNTYRPSPYVTEYEYIQPPPQQQTHYSRINQYHHYNEDQPYHNVNNGNGNITSIFSDENPNACAVM